MNDFIEVTVATYYNSRYYDVGSTVLIRKRDIVSLERIPGDDGTCLYLRGEEDDYLKAKESLDYIKEQWDL